MKQVNNGYANNYYLTEDGKLYNADTGNYIKFDSRHLVKLKKEDGSYNKIALKTLYRLVYNKPYCKDSIENLDNEVWKEIDNTDNTYFVSNKGRVKSYSGYQAIILKPTITKGGYSRLDIIEEGQRVSKLVHRLVAAAFLPLPKSIDWQLHHKDFNKNNNSVDNLEWLSCQQHIKKHSERREELAATAESTEPKGNNNT